MILEVARRDFHDNDSKSIVAQMRACAEGAFHSIPLEVNNLVLRLAREQRFFKKNDSATHSTDQEYGHEHLIESDEPNACGHTVIQEFFVRAARTSSATKCSSNLRTGIPKSELRYILPGSELLAYHLSI